jgi:hypothetical protein
MWPLGRPEGRWKDICAAAASDDDDDDDRAGGKDVVAGGRVELVQDCVLWRNST